MTDRPTDRLTDRRTDRQSHSHARSLTHRAQSQRSITELTYSRTPTLPYAHSHACSQGCVAGRRGSSPGRRRGGGADRPECGGGGQRCGMLFGGRGSGGGGGGARGAGRKAGTPGVAHGDHRLGEGQACLGQSKAALACTPQAVAPAVALESPHSTSLAGHSACGTTLPRTRCLLSSAQAAGACPLCANARGNGSSWQAEEERAVLLREMHASMPAGGFDGERHGHVRFKAEPLCGGPLRSRCCFGSSCFDSSCAVGRGRFTGRSCSPPACRTTRSRRSPPLACRMLAA